jgi:hypothetical protein
MSNPRKLQSRAGNSIILHLLSSVFFLLCLTSNVALALGEGSTTAPLLLGVDSPHQGSVDGISPRSYYHFRTNEAGGYAIRLTNTHSNFGFNLYTSQFASLVDDNGYDSTVRTPNGDKTCVYNLAADTDYAIDVTDWDFVADSYTITVNGLRSEGSPGAPVPIADGTGHAGMVDAASFSYYSFTPSSSGAYTLAITGTNYSGFPLFNTTTLQIDTYAGADFSTGLLRSCTPAYGAIYCTVNGLTQGVPVYIKISEIDSSPSDTIFTITPTKGIGEGSVANPVVLAVGSPHAGGVDAGSNLFYQGCTNPSYSYYSFNTAVGAGGYTVTTDNADANSVRMELFRSFSGASLASCDYSSQVKPCMFSNIDSDSNYYLRATNCNNAIVNYNILVKNEGSEGSVNNPVHLTLETSHVGAIGFYETSYFTFTTDKSGTYDIILDQALSWSYTSSPDFTGSGYAYGSTTANLDANRTYYLRVSNLGNPGIMQVYTVKVAHGASEGSIATPINLTVGTTYRATVGTQGRSYYTFTTLAATDYYITFNNPTELAVHAYTNPDFSNGSITTACPGPGPYISCTLENLTANTPYYIEAHEWANLNAAFNIHIYLLDHLAGCSAGSECYNFESGVIAPFTPTSNVTKGGASKSLWALDATNNAATGGTQSLKSGTLSYSQTTPQYTCFEYMRTTTTYSVLFSLKVNPPSSNTLEFSIDGTVQPNGTFYNMPAWKRVMFFPTPGPHTYKWCFNENNPNPTTSDSAWVDDIEFISPLVLVNGLGSSFATIQDAKSAAIANSMTNPVLKARAVTFDGPFTFDTPADVTLKGGLDPAFTSEIGYSYLNGTLTIKSGSLRVKNVVIR